MQYQSFSPATIRPQSGKQRIFTPPFRAVIMTSSACGAAAFGKRKTHGACTVRKTGKAKPAYSAPVTA
jgi:hypothetical protein